MSKPVISSASFTTSRSDLDGPLPLPDGRDARSLRWSPLRKALAPILDELDPSAGKAELLRAYAAHLEAAAAAGVETALQAALERGAA